MALLDDVKQNFIDVMMATSPDYYPDAASVQAQIDSTQQTVDSLDTATLVLYNQMYLPYVFTGTESTYQATYDNLGSLTDQQLRDGVMILVLYYQIKTASSAPVIDTRTDYNLMGRLNLQATIPSDGNLLSRSKVTISSPNPAIWPNSTPGQEITEPVTGTFNLGFSNWRGAVVFSNTRYTGYQTQYLFDNSFDYDNDVAIYGDSLSNLNPPGYAMMGPIVIKDGWIPGSPDSWYKNIPNFQVSGFSGPQLMTNATQAYRSVSRNFIDSVLTSIDFLSASYFSTGNFTVNGGANNSKSNTVVFTTNSTDPAYLTKTDSDTIDELSIYAGEGAVPYLLLEARILGDISNKIYEAGGFDKDDIKYSLLDSMPQSNLNKISNYTDVCSKIVSPHSAWTWSTVVNLISKEEWPEIVTITMRDPDTNNVVAQRNIAVIQNKVAIDNAGNTAYHIHLRETNYAYDNSRFDNFGQNVNSDLFIRDPWFDVPYSFLPGEGKQTYVMEITRPEIPSLPVSNDIMPSNINVIPTVTAQYLIDNDSLLSSSKIYNMNGGLWSRFSLISYPYGIGDPITASYWYNGYHSGAFNSVYEARAGLLALSNNTATNGSKISEELTGALTGSELYNMLVAEGFDQMTNFSGYTSFLSTLTGLPSTYNTSDRASFYNIRDAYAVYLMQLDFENIKNDPKVNLYALDVPSASGYYNYNRFWSDKPLIGWSGNSVNNTMTYDDVDAIPEYSEATSYTYLVHGGYYGKGMTYPDATLYLSDLSTTSYARYYQQWPLFPINDNVISKYEMKVDMSISFSTAIPGYVSQGMTFDNITIGQWTQCSNSWNIYVDYDSILAASGNATNIMYCSFTIQIRDSVSQEILGDKLFRINLRVTP